MAMRKVAREALTHVLGAKQGEHLLIVVDEHRIEIGNAFYEAGDQLDLEGRLFVLEDSERPLEDLPAELRGRAPEPEGGITSLAGLSASRRRPSALPAPSMKDGSRPSASAAATAGAPAPRGSSGPIWERAAWRGSCPARHRARPAPRGSASRHTPR